MPQLMKNWREWPVAAKQKMLEGLQRKRVELDARRGQLQPFGEWMQEVLPHYCTLPPSKMHQKIDTELDDFHEVRGQRRGKVAPRGGAKTTRITKGYTLYCTCHNLESYIGVIKDTYEQAVEDVSAIRDELESNEVIAKRYPHVAGKGRAWSENRVETKNGICIQAFGSGSKIRGRTFGEHRVSLFIFDDIDNDEDVLSERRRSKTWNWFTRAAIPAGNRDSNMLFVGTAQHRLDTLQRLKTQPGWLVETFRSVIKWPDDMKLWDKWETIFNNVMNPDRIDDARSFYEKHEADMLAGSEVLWEENENLYNLMSLRATIGESAFSAEKQGVATNVMANEWPDSYFDSEDLKFERWPKTKLRVIALDPSKGKSDDGDYSAYTMLGLGLDDVLYCEADLQRRDVAKIAIDGIDHFEDFRPAAFGCESNGFQELVGGELRREAELRKLTLPLFEINNHINKKVRIRSLTPFLKQKKIRYKANSRGTDLLVEQLREFPSGDHDDGPDSLEMAVRLMMFMFSGEDGITSSMLKAGGVS